MVVFKLNLVVLVSVIVFLLVLNVNSMVIGLKIFFCVMGVLEFSLVIMVGG